MTLALLVPNDYRHNPVLVRLDWSEEDQITYFHTLPPHRTPQTEASIASFAKGGGEIFRLHRDDDTSPGKRR